MSVIARSRPTLSFRILDVDVSIRGAAPGVEALLEAHYGWMPGPVEAADLTYTVARSDGRFLLAVDREEAAGAADLGELLWLLDQDLVVQLQRRRPDLYFVHAGVLEHAGRALLLVAPSGGGKSTTTWALVHHGFRYLSDELAPVDLRTATVHPYPRALALKSRPPRAYPLPRGTLATSRGFHVSTDALAGGVRATAAPVAAIFFLRYAPDAPGLPVERLSTAEAGARLYANVLNALAHPDDGLDGAIRLAGDTVGFTLSTADLTATAALVEATLDRLPPR